jgi:AcrR family transcriptional regulator
MAVSTDAGVTAAAVKLFGTRGYAATSMEQVRRAAGVSNGSLYHLYPTKAALAARLYGDGMQDCQHGILHAVESASSPELAIRGAVLFQATWVDQHVERARLTYADWHDEVVVAAAPRLHESSRAYVRIVERWLRDHIANGRLVDGPFPVLHALWLGPTQEFCRQWLSGRARLRPRQVAGQLADGAWRTLSLR